MNPFIYFVGAIAIAGLALYGTAWQGHVADCWLMPSFALEILSILALLILILTGYVYAAAKKRKEYTPSAYLGGIAVKMIVTLSLFGALAYVDNQSMVENFLLGVSAYVLYTLLAVVFLWKAISQASKK